MALSKLPSDNLERFALLLEATRVLDYSTVFHEALEEAGRFSRPDFDLICSGWNLAASYLLTPIKAKGIPAFASTQQTRQFAINVLHKFGQSVLLRRASAMIRSGFLHVQKVPKGLSVRLAGGAKDQFLDNLEFSRLSKLESRLNNSELKFHRGWELFESTNLASLKDAPGYFLARASKNPLSAFKCENIDEQMLPLVHPWDSGRGIMMGYGATPTVDGHFLAEATELVVQYRDEAGLHPTANLGDVSAADLIAITAFIASLHMKHVRFAMLAMKHFPQISIPQSLTIWGPLAELQQSIVDYAGLSTTQVRSALEAITLRAEEAPRLREKTLPMVPLLLSLGNGMILRPVSSLGRNPFIGARALLEWRHPGLTHQISAPREDWLRSELYCLFQGTRFKRVHGNVKLRHDNRVLTDIDAAVFDTLTGELALFQLKWQDYFTNDVRELRSKARNLTEELDSWATKVDAWVQQYGSAELLTALRLKLNKRQQVRNVYMFGLSRSYARMQGFGFPIGCEKLAIANWPQFVRNRYEIGPGQVVFTKLFHALNEEMSAPVDGMPISFRVQGGNESICFEDLWNIFEDDES